MLVQALSGNIYWFRPGSRIYRLDGFGVPVMSSCWHVSFRYGMGDRVWALRMALRFDERRMLRELPWVPVGREPPDPPQHPNPIAPRQRLRSPRGRG